MGKKLEFLRGINIPGATYGVIVLLILFSLITNKFLTLANIFFIARSSSILLIASIGMTMVILVSQIDLSVGSVMSLSGVIAALCLQNGMGIPIAILLGIASGIVFGIINGIMVAVYKFDYWISTFATMGVGAGLALVFANGETIPIADEAFGWLGNGKLFGIYVIIYITIILVAIMMFVLGKTKFGYNIYSIGGSEQTALLSGIDVVKNRVYVYICSGLFASMAGLLLASMCNSASPIAGADYSFDAIAAVIIGGTSFDGGKGGLLGTVMGTLMLRILTSGLNLMGFSAIWQKAIIGVVIVAILVGDALNEKRKKKNDMRRTYAYEN
ncbi:MAG: ABC transporter permease [Thermoanaerobacteraceae bacterium]|nr:ABC transporter permease [Thermoanaerobacteraceae bacterium]